MKRWGKTIGCREVDKVMNRLAPAWRAQHASGPEAGPAWRYGVMRAVRAQGNGAALSSRPWLTLESPMYLTPAALALMLALSILLVRVGAALESLITEMMVADPIQLYLAYAPF